VVGQRMNLVARWLGPGQPTNLGSGRWNIGGKAVAGFYVSEDNTVGEPIPLSEGQQQIPISEGLAGISFIWYAASTSGERDSVSYSVAGSSETVAPNVAAPEALVTTLSGNTFDTNGQPITVAGTSDTNKSTSVQNNLWNYVSSGKPTTDSKGLAGIGIDFQAYAKEPFSLSGGKYEWVQIVSSSSYEKGGLFGFGNKAKSHQGLDGEYPYSAPGAESSTFEVGTGGAHILNYVTSTSDTPTIFSQYSEFGSNLHARMYLMYEPAGGGAQDWVPLVTVTWTWFGNVVGSTVINVLTVVNDGPSTEYPTWNSIVPRQLN
jgi:hypothetical protein